MSMLKIITPESLVWDQPVVQQVKRSSRGLLGSDLAGLEKRAGSELLQLARDVKLPDDEVLVHLIAMGSTEKYGSNRNGDGFKEAMLRRCHPTFVKHAMFYRNHQNKNRRKSYGRIIKSAFHEPMSRVELLVALNGSEEAARRNNGLVADQEIQKLASGKDLPVSMAIRVPFDLCSACNNKAPRVEDYCTGIQEGGRCKAGGLKHNIGALVKLDGDIHQLHADNPDGYFFDISNVFRPADRIAYVTGVLNKEAAAGSLVKSAELAAAVGLTLPLELVIEGEYPSGTAKMLKLAYYLADLESHLPTERFGVPRQYALSFLARPVAADASAPEMAREKFALTLRALADTRSCMPLVHFLEMVGNFPSKEKAAEAAAISGMHLPGVFNRLIADPDLPERIQNCRYAPAAACAPPTLDIWARRKAADWSLREPYVIKRMTRAALAGMSASLRQSGDSEKTANDRDPAKRLAEEYGLYQLAFLGSLPESEPYETLTGPLVVLQNYSCEL